MSYPRWVLSLPFVIVFFYLNYWMWDIADIVLGLPANLLYHVVLSLALIPLMVGLVRRAWPSYLDED